MRPAMQMQEQQHPLLAWWERQVAWMRAALRMLLLIPLFLLPALLGPQHAAARAREVCVGVSAWGDIARECQRVPDAPSSLPLLVAAHSATKLPACVCC
jgi:hypothetical protein